ncbi:MAG: cytochrome P450 [Deltaproteobacteria bacterium]|nr:cytochrome P450 [Deltaproteobacteria bacterium]
MPTRHATHTVMARIDFSPTDLVGLDDPYPRLAALRRIAPVVRLESGFWAVTGYQAAMEVFRQRGAASGPIAQRYLASLPPGAARDEMSHRINFLDPPDHTRVRGLVSKAFTPRRVADLLPWIAATAARLLDELADDSRIDLLASFAHQVPSLVISELLGVPSADRDQLTAWSDAVAPLLGVELSDADRARALPASEAFHAYLGALLDERRRRPGDDLLSALLAAEEDGERLSRVELLSLAATLYSAGHRTTRDLFSNGLSVLLRDPLRYARVVAGEWAVADVIAEFLRYETPTLFVVRIPLEPVSVGGETIGPYEPILIYLAAANRDPAVYAEPDEFRPRPEAPPALSFAYGPHYCLGASLARNEAEAMLSALVRRCPRLALAAPLRWHLRGPFRGLDELRVRIPPFEEGG